MSVKKSKYFVIVLDIRKVFFVFHGEESIASLKSLVLRPIKIVK